MTAPPFQGTEPPPDVAQHQALPPGVRASWPRQTGRGVPAQVGLSLPPGAGKPVDFDAYGDPHIAAAVLKAFLRELPQPLLTVPAYEQALGITSRCRPRVPGFLGGRNQAREKGGGWG